MVIFGQKFSPNSSRPKLRANFFPPKSAAKISRIFSSLRAIKPFPVVYSVSGDSNSDLTARSKARSNA
jgi:hypothetical protein